MIYNPYRWEVWDPPGRLFYLSRSKQTLGLAFVTKLPPGASWPASLGARILSWSEAPLIFIAGPRSHEPQEGTS